MTDEHETAHDSGVAVVGGPARGSSTEDEHSAQGAPVVPRRVRMRSVSPRPATPGWLMPVLVAVTVVSVISAIVFGVKWSDLSAQNDQRAAVTNSAKAFLTALTNFNTGTIDADFHTISIEATGDFAKQSNRFFGSSIRQQLEAAQAWSRGQIRYVYVQSLDGGQSQVYAEVDQTYANDKVTQPIADVLQVVLGLTDVSGTWKISAVTVLPPPSSSSSPGAPAGK